jgi:Cdc6-like AAA superfamily ATPase
VIILDEVEHLIGTKHPEIMRQLFSIPFLKEKERRSSFLFFGIANALDLLDRHFSNSQIQVRKQTNKQTKQTNK